MSTALELIIQQIKIIGSITKNQSHLSQPGKQQTKQLVIHYDQNPQNLQQVIQNARSNSISQQLVSPNADLPLKKFRMEFGSDHYISKDYGYYVSPNELFFDEPMTFVYDNHNHAYIMTIQVFQQHQYGDNSDIDRILNAQIDLSDFSNLHGDFLESKLCSSNGDAVGKIIITIEVFRRTFKYMQKVVNAVFFQKVKQEKQKNQYKLLVANKNIKNLLVNNNITNTLMTINSFHLIFDKQEAEAYGKQCFIMIKYGPTIKTFTKITKAFSKENVSWIQYHQFMKNDDFKFVFYFFHYDQWNKIVCKAMGEIKYIVFDETINCHSISLYDKRSNKYGNLMVKFQQKEVQHIKITYKLDKKMKEQQERISEAVEEYMRAKFQAKYNNAVLSQKLRQMELKRLQEQDDKNRPLNDDQKKQKQAQSKFIQFLQKQVIKIEKQLLKRDKQNKQIEKKQKFLPIIHSRENQRSRSPTGTERSGQSASNRYGYKFMNNLSANNIKIKKKISENPSNLMSQSFTAGDFIRKETIKLPKV